MQKPAAVTYTTLLCGVLALRPAAGGLNSILSRVDRHWHGCLSVCLSVLHSNRYMCQALDSAELAGRACKGRQCEKAARRQSASKQWAGIASR